MGLIKNNFYIKELGVEVPTAYARIVSISIGKDGQTASMLQIKSSREAFDDIVASPYSGIVESPTYASLCVNFKADKKLSIWEQTYSEFKKLEELSDWKDDIVE